MFQQYGAPGIFIKKKEAVYLPLKTEQGSFLSISLIDFFWEDPCRISLLKAERIMRSSSHHATAPRPAFCRNGLFKLKLGSVTGNMNRASFAEFSLKQLL